MNARSASVLASIVSSFARTRAAPGVAVALRRRLLILRLCLRLRHFQSFSGVSWRATTYTLIGDPQGEFGRKSGKISDSFVGASRPDAAGTSLAIELFVGYRSLSSRSDPRWKIQN
jgi:hypothetical protein